METDVRSTIDTLQASRQPLSAKTEENQPVENSLNVLNIGRPENSGGINSHKSFLKRKRNSALATNKENVEVKIQDFANLKDLDKGKAKRRSKKGKRGKSYFCPSCCSKVDTNKRKHDLIVHRPPQPLFVPVAKKPIATPTGLLNTENLSCSLCPQIKAGFTQQSLELHQKTFHQNENLPSLQNSSAAGVASKPIQPLLRRGTAIGKKVPQAIKVKAKLQCFECNVFVPRKFYILHLKRHDRERVKADTKNLQSPSNKCRKLFRSMDSLREEFQTRRYVYKDQEDPRWNGEDAVLQCRHCPFQLFSTWSRFEKHVRRLHPYVPNPPPPNSLTAAAVAQNSTIIVEIVEALNTPDDVNCPEAESALMLKTE